MAGTAYWKGYLKLSLVTCPVAMTPATTESGAVRFRTLNAKTSHPVVSRYIDAATGKAVEDDEQVKGYPVGPDHYVQLEDDEIDAVALESTRTIDIATFVAKDTVDWIWFDKPHYLAPNDAVGEEAFSVIREAMAATQAVGIARLVLYRRERAVLLEPRDRGIVLWTLRYGDEVRDAETYFKAIQPENATADALGLMSKLIHNKLEPWSTKRMADPVQEKLLDIIAAKKSTKKKGGAAKTTVENEAPATEGNVIDIMEALKRSLAGSKRV